MRSPSSPTPPTVIMGLAVIFLTQPAKPRGESGRGLEVPSGGGVEDVHPGGEQRCQQCFQLVRRLGQTGVVVTSLPVRETEDDGKSRAGSGSAGSDDFGGEARPGSRSTAVEVGAEVGARPEELVE